MASLAKKNLDSGGPFNPGLLAPPTSEPPVLKETVGLLFMSLSPTALPGPGVGVASCAPRNESLDTA